MTLGSFLDVALLDIKASYIVRPEYIEITTMEQRIEEKVTRALEIGDLAFAAPNSINQQALHQNLAVFGAATPDLRPGGSGRPSSSANSATAGSAAAAAGSARAAASAALGGGGVGQGRRRRPLGGGGGGGQLGARGRAAATWGRRGRAGHHRRPTRPVRQPGRPVRHPGEQPVARC